jgi:hypothetical protein
MKRSADFHLGLMKTNRPPTSRMNATASKTRAHPHGRLDTYRNDPATAVSSMITTLATDHVMSSATVRR